MATDIKIPFVGMAAADATIIEWSAKEGDRVAERQVVVVLETEKVRTDVEALSAGFLHITCEAGFAGPPGMVIGMLAETKEELEALQKEPPKEKAPAPAVEETKAAAAPEAKAEPPKEAAAAGKREERIKISPVARKMAEEHAIDITQIAGTGPGGRIARQDIEKAVAAKGAAPGKAPAPAEVAEGKKSKDDYPS